MIFCFQIKESCKGKYPILGQSVLQPVGLIDAPRSRISNCTMILLTRILEEHFICGERSSQAAADLINKQNSSTVGA